MRKIKKIISILLTVIIACTCVSLLASCSDKSKLYVINFRPEDQSYYSWLEKEFEKKNPTVDVRYEAVDTAGYSQLLQSRLVGGNLDVFGTQAAYVATDEFATKMLPLNDITLKDGTKLFDTLKEGDKQECVLDGNYLVAPLSSFAEIVFYNKSMFAEHELSVPTTFNEFVAVCETLKSKSAVKAPIVCGNLDLWPIAMIYESLEPGLIRAEDADFYLKISKGEQSFNDPITVEWFKRIQKVTSYFQPNASGTAYAMAPGMFASGEYGMMIDGSWSLKDIYSAEPEFEIGAFAMPASDTVSKNNIAAAKVGGGWSVNSSSANKDLAKAFIAFQFEDANYAKYMDFMQSNPSKIGVEITDKTAKEIAAIPTSLTMSNFWTFLDINELKTITTNLLLNSTTPQQAAVDMESYIQRQKPNWNTDTILNRWYSRFYPNEVKA